MTSKNVSIYCTATNTRKSYPIGTTLLEMQPDFELPYKNQIVAARVNYKSEDLNFAVYKPKDISFVEINSSSGIRVYVRTLALVLSKALSELFPDGARLKIEHPLSKGYFCRIMLKNQDLTAETVACIKQKMLEIISRNLPIVRHERQTSEVIEFFTRQNRQDVVRLLQTLSRPYAEYYELDGHYDYYNGALLPHTGHLNVFDLIPHYDGVLLKIPARANPQVLEEFIPQPKMYEIFNEYIRWNSLMGVSNVGELNHACSHRGAYDIIKIAEALHEKKIAGIADRIAENLHRTRCVMVSGPSSSGKTTFSKRLSVQLQAIGITPLIISLDNYFVDREKTPRDANGDYDFEHIEALDIDFFNQQLKQLLTGEEIEMPTFNFETGKRMFKGNKMRLGAKNILLMEGIHALNPELTPAISEDTKFKIYVSALTTISLDDHNWISTTDNRLLRRIIRDNRYRGYSAQDTIGRWQSVRQGEDRWIFPFQENADVMFNSALIFEFAVLKRYAEPVLDAVPHDSEEFSEAHRLLKFLKYFTPIYDREIPPTSLLREFLGGSSFRY